jgi:hypothetical protein
VKTLSNCFKSIRAASVVAMLGCVTVTSNLALAGADSECHFHGTKPASEETIIKCANYHRDRLVKKGSIEAVWTPLKHETLLKIDAKDGKKEWKVTYKDPAAKDKTKETLYMFFSEPGNLLASNFSGK